MVQDGVQWFGQPKTWTLSLTSTGHPDVVVDSVSVSPPTPRAGQQTTFASVVRNAGSAATPAGVTIGVGYIVDGAYTTWGAVSGPLAAGASATITTQGGPWTATAGTHTITALADDVNPFAESNEDNNARSTSLTVASPPTADQDLFGMNVDPANPAGNPSAPQLAALGVRWVRVEWKARGRPHPP
jgi:subtilase family serine protease